MNSLMSTLNSKFALKNLGVFNYFLGIEITFQSDLVHHSSNKYVRKLLARCSLLDSKVYDTPMACDKELNKDDDIPLVDTSIFHSVFG